MLHASLRRPQVLLAKRHSWRASSFFFCSSRSRFELSSFRDSLARLPPRRLLNEGLEVAWRVLNVAEHFLTKTPHDSPASPPPLSPTVRKYACHMMRFNELLPH
ncbi:Protein of unknown function [Gryllus bimaculatus]|nr:Protein of unknown function [Gryllus bimaculatus]